MTLEMKYNAEFNYQFKTEERRAMMLLYSFNEFIKYVLDGFDQDIKVLAKFEKIIINKSNDFTQSIEKGDIARADVLIIEMINLITDNFNSDIDKITEELADYSEKFKSDICNITVKPFRKIGSTKYLKDINVQDSPIGANYFKDMIDRNKGPIKINQSELIELIVIDLSIDKSTAKQLLNAIKNKIVKFIADNGSIYIPDAGYLRSHTIKSGLRRNPKTGESVTVKEHSVIRLTNTNKNSKYIGTWQSVVDLEGMDEEVPSSLQRDFVLKFFNSISLIKRYDICLKITGMGVFYHNKKKARPGWNFQLNEEMEIPAMNNVKFRCSTILKDKLATLIQNR